MLNAAVVAAVEKVMHHAETHPPVAFDVTTLQNDSAAVATKEDVLAVVGLVICSKPRTQVNELGV